MDRIESVHSDELSALLASWREGFSMDASFYTCDAVYRKDLEAVFYRHWLYAGHVSQLPDPGSYFLATPGEESVIAVRDQKGEVRAFANVCRHRGSRICTREQGKVRAFVCPYHAWAYELDGKLRSKRSMPEGFDPSGYGLKPVRCEVYNGLVFINLGEGAPGLVDSLQELDKAFLTYDLENSKVACQETYTVEANWKLAVENFMECYHCAPAHAEYARCHTLKSPKDNEALRPAMLVEAEKIGYSTVTVSNPFPGGTDEIQYYYARNALYAPCVTGSRDGNPVAPLLGSIEEYGGGVADFQIGPVFYGLLYPDHVVLYRFVPRGVQLTDMDIIWLVRSDAEEGRDYDLDELAWMWHVTSEADKKIILYNQQGVNSRYYEPGPLSEMEEFTSLFNKWYLAQIKSHQHRCGVTDSSPDGKEVVQQDPKTGID
jgi:Rieske 2Fe-2S family protein